MLYTVYIQNTVYVLYGIHVKYFNFNFNNPGTYETFTK